MRRSYPFSRWILYLIFVLVSAGLIFVLYPSSEGLIVKEVMDGDTMMLLDGEKVRYIGIDTPEKGEPFSGKPPERIKSWCKEGRSL